MKNRAFIKYKKNGDIVPGSLIITNGGYPNGKPYKEITIDLCCDEHTSIGFTNKNKNRAFVKYTKTGEIVPGSLIITNGEYPKGGPYKEINTSLCCDTPSPITTTTSTTTSTTTTTEIPYPLSICVYKDYGMGILSGTLNFTTVEEGYPVYEGLLTEGSSGQTSYTVKHWITPPIQNPSITPYSWQLYHSAYWPGLGISDYTEATSELNPILVTWIGGSVTSEDCPYPSSVCSHIYVQGVSQLAFGTLNLTGLDENGYPEYSGDLNYGYTPTTLTYSFANSQWRFVTTGAHADTINSQFTTDLDPTVVDYQGGDLLSGACTYPLNVCSRLYVQGLTAPAFGSLVFTSFDSNGYPQYAGLMNFDTTNTPATLAYSTTSTQWIFTTTGSLADVIGSDITTSLDPTVVDYNGNNILPGFCPP